MKGKTTITLDVATAITTPDKANYIVEYSDNGSFTTGHMTTVSPISVSYINKVTTIVVRGTLMDLTSPAKLKVIATNVKDLAGNVQTMGTAATK